MRFIDNFAIGLVVGAVFAAVIVAIGAFVVFF
jgi:hypothetical protein